MNLNKLSTFIYMEATNVSNINICYSQLLINLIIVTAFCTFLYNFLYKRTINIENFDSSEKITYSIDGHPINVE